MRLSPREIEKLILHNAGFLAQKRYSRGLKLNYVEAVSLIASQLQEFIREGYTVSALMNLGKQILGFSDVMPNVPEMVHEVQVEGTFPDGTKLVTVHDPICRESGEEYLALYGSGLMRIVSSRAPDNSTGYKPGEIICADGEILLNEGRKTLTLEVVNRGDRPIQVGSHYPFFETNPALDFERAKTFGFRLNLPSGAAVRFEPGESKIVELVEIGGQKKVFGAHNLISGDISAANKMTALARAKKLGFSGADHE
jgi:urease subunit gamma/beta